LHEADERLHPIDEIKEEEREEGQKVAWYHSRGIKEEDEGIKGDVDFHCPPATP
jgi:hypothetical protein